MELCGGWKIEKWLIKHVEEVSDLWFDGILLANDVAESFNFVFFAVQSAVYWIDAFS